MNTSPNEKQTAPVGNTKKEVAPDYLTQIKELPEEPERGKITKTKTARPKVPNIKTIVSQTDVKTQPVRQTQRRIYVKQVPKNEEEQEEELEAKDKGKKAGLHLPARDVILGVVNILTVVILMFILAKLPSQAQEVKRLRKESIQGEENITLTLSDINANSEKAEKIKSLLLNESGVVDFVKEVENLKKAGTVSKLSFASQKAVKDKTGNYGIPVIIEMKGNLGDISHDLARIRNLPFLFRAVTIEAFTNEEELIELKYGGFLYVQDKLGEI